MRTNLLHLTGSSILLLLTCAADGLSQPGGEASKGKGSSNSLDMDKEILRQIKEAYKAPHEVPQDVLSELRGLYKQHSEKREAEIFRELRRMYLFSQAQEHMLLQQIRRAAEQPSPEMEARLFREIDRMERLPEGVVPPSTQTSQAEKLFRKLDLNGDDLLSRDEMPDPLRAERPRWDTRRDGFIDMDEYWAYYQSRLQFLTKEVISGNIELGLKRGGPTVVQPPIDDDARPMVFRGGKLPKGLPAWFGQCDTDKDGQVALYEWQRAGNALQDFAALDRNDDGFLTAEEVLRYLAQNAEAPAVASGGERSPSDPDSKKGKKKKQ